MTVKEMYDHITSHMTPEEALLKLLEGPLLQYQKLKFNKGKEVHPILIITMAAMDLDWSLAMDKDSETVNGMVVGTDKYMDKFFKDNKQ